MNLYDFFSCDHEERAELVCTQGELVIVRGSGAYRICLYTMGRFFAEVWYRADNNEVDLVRGFKSLDMLEPYLELVNLSEITED
ncbi:hypothetical protein AHMF7605_11060 [Adhaeribacter arboris]|uniref:Uncharacterized protein n=1 Tax=Adhaeribacter arboris TaxID=2072846 RepID=A0A2T2YES7_9BACT|nr:hypothetical protein [Adhaeribacter arboris]PSR54021.1 hypothetical protein AHMF7605_11060 [Adhaeribacter arboris]